MDSEFEKIKEGNAMIFTENMMKNINNYLQPYINVLANKSTQLVYKDDYGDWQFEDWWKEIDWFIENKLVALKQDLSQAARKSFLSWYQGDSYEVKEEIQAIAIDDILFKLRFKIAKIVSEYLDARGIDNEYNLEDPVLFEKSVAQNFESYGWEATLTKSTGDQGADVIAKSGNRTIVAQCKLYSQPVGNKAIQEAFSAKQYYNADFAFVVTNASFTKSALQLAESTKVVPIHYSQLSEILNGKGID